MTRYFDIAAGALLLLCDRDLDTITAEEVVAAVTNAAPPDATLDDLQMAVIAVLETKSRLLTPSEKTLDIFRDSN